MWAKVGTYLSGFSSLLSTMGEELQGNCISHYIYFVALDLSVELMQSCVCLARAVNRGGVTAWSYCRMQQLPYLPA